MADSRACQSAARLGLKGLVLVPRRRAVVVGCGPFLAPVFGRPPADPFCKGIGKDEGVMVADFVSDGFNGQFGRGKQLSRAAHAQISDLVHGAATELTTAKSAQVFIAVAGLAGKFCQGPCVGQVRGHPFPQHPELVRLISGLGKAEHVSMNEVGPFLHEGRLAGTVTFIHQPENCGLQGQRVEARHDGRSGIGDRPLLIGPLIADPAKLPTRTRNRFEGIQSVSRQQAGKARAANTPATVDHDEAFAAIACQEVSRGLFGPHDLHGRARFVGSHVNDLILRQHLANREALNPGTRFHVGGPRAAHPRTGVMDRGIRQLEVSLGHLTEAILAI